MQSEVRIIQDDRNEWKFELDRLSPISQAEGRDWLDAQFIELGGEPLRPTGKLLLADKVLVVAREAGPARFNDADWGAHFARAASAALSRPVVVVDLRSMTVSY